jgi:excisionase family DNA binding protein
MDNDALMTTQEVASALRVSRQTVTRWVRDGKLKAIRIRVGTRSVYRIRRSAFLSFLRTYVRDE